jgi:hypothetical protein
MLLSAAAVGLAVLVTRRAPAHRPIAFALVAAKACEIVRPMLPSQPNMVLLLALPALSAWATLRALCWYEARWRCGIAWFVAGTWVCWGPVPALWWGAVYPVALGAAVGVEGAAWWRWRRTGGIAGVTQRTAAALSAGDLGVLIAGLVFGWTSSWIGHAADAIAVATCALQGAWLVRQAHGSGGGKNPMGRRGRGRDS